MTYLAGGKQFIVVATNDGRLVALSLPGKTAETASAARQAEASANL